MIFAIGNNNDCSLNGLLRRRTMRFLEDAEPFATVVYQASEKAITGVSAADPVVVTAIAHGLQEGDHVVIRGVEGVEVANGVHEVGAVTDDTFLLLGVDGTEGDYEAEGKVYKAVPGAVEIELEADEEVPGKYDGVFSGLIKFRRRTAYRSYIVDHGPYAGEYEWFISCNADDRG